jgi:hypothetical protein
MVCTTCLYPLRTHLFLTLMKTRFLTVLILSALGICRLSAQMPLPDVFKYVEPKIPFDEAAAATQLEPGTATIRGTISAKENKALIKALNISKKHVAYKGTVVTLMPHSAYIDEWRALDKKLRRKAVLEKAAISAQANSYRILVRVTDDKGSFEFKNLKPGKYFIYADVDFVVSGSSFVQTGTSTTSNAVTGQILDSRPIGYYEPFTADVSKMAAGVVTVSTEGQIVETKISGQ